MEEILATWEVDSQVDYTRLGYVSVEVARLHWKYWQYFIEESIRLKKLEQERARIYMELFEHYTQGASQEAIARGWKMPPVGKVLKGEARMYIDADSNLHAIDSRVTLQEEKVKFLDSIIKMIKDRTYQVRAAIDFEKMKAGN